jgi:hypothetical protein
MVCPGKGRQSGNMEIELLPELVKALLPPCDHAVIILHKSDVQYARAGRCRNTRGPVC